MNTRKDPISNGEKVMAVASNGMSVEYTFGQLKQDFQNKQLKIVVDKVYVPRTKKSYKINVRSTKGLSFTRVK